MVGQAYPYIIIVKLLVGLLYANVLVMVNCFWVFCILVLKIIAFCVFLALNIYFWQFEPWMFEKHVNKLNYWRMLNVKNYGWFVICKRFNNGNLFWVFFILVFKFIAFWYFLAFKYLFLTIWTLIVWRTFFLLRARKTC